MVLTPNNKSDLSHDSNFDGLTPLQHAAENGHDEVVKLFLNHHTGSKVKIATAKAFAIRR